MTRNNMLALDLNKIKPELPMSHESWFNDNCIKFYWQLLDFVPMNGTIIECGSFFGRSICSISEYIKYKNITAICIDVNIKPLFKNLMKRRLFSHIKVIKSDSIIAAKQFEDNSIDMIFLDSIHTYKHMIGELTAYKNKMKDDSIISGKECGLGFSTRPKFVNERSAVDYAFGNNYTTIQDISCGGMWYGFKKDLKI